jgi:hypothetical protein
MSSARRRLLRNLRKHFISRRPEAVVSSAFKPSISDGICMEPSADIPESTP